MKPILFFVESISLCHVARLITIARIVRDSGADVLFACGENQRQLVQDKGFDAVTVPVLPPETVYGRLKQLEPTYRFQDLENYYQHDLPLVENIDPRLIIFDMRLTVPLIGEKLDIPTISVSNGIYSDHFARPLGMPFLMSKNIPLPNAWLDALLNSAIGRRIAARKERPFSRPIDQLYEKHGGRPLGKFARYLSGGDFSLVADIPDIAPLDGDHPRAAHIGPAPWEPPASLKGNAGDIAIPKDKRAVYLSMGSSIFPEALVRPTVEALLDRGYHVLLQIGNQTITDLPTHADLQVHKFVSNAQVLPQVDVLISHGGVTTSYEAMIAGVPVIGIPSFTDQQWNMERFVEAGAGAVLSPYNLSPQLILETVDRLTRDPAFAQRARDIGQAVNAYPIDQTVLRVVNELIRSEESDDTR